jgi:ribosomal protein L16 Arg81 hydroxylase
LAAVGPRAPGFRTGLVAIFPQYHGKRLPLVVTELPGGILYALQNDGKAMLVALADVLAPISISEFLDVFRARKRLHVVTTDPNRAETLLSWREINTLLSERALDENVIIMRDGTLIPRQFYTSKNGKGLNVSAFHDLLSQGVSLIVNSIDRLIPQIRQLAASVEREMRVKTQVNAYLSFSKGGAFKPHLDGHDVLVLQVHGSKRWQIWKAELPYPIENRSNLRLSKAPEQEVELAPGDVLFIPRGEPHSAAVFGNNSVHLTINLRTNTGIDFLDHLRRQAIDDPILRMDLPWHASAEELIAHDTAVKNRLHKMIQAASITQFLLESDLSRSPDWQTAVSGAFPNKEDILRLTLRRRIPLPDVTPGTEPQALTIGGEVQRLSPACIDVLRWLFDHDPATLGEISAGISSRHGQDSTEVAIRELLRLGFLFMNPSGDREAAARVSDHAHQ